VTASWLVGEPNNTGLILYCGSKELTAANTISQDTWEHPVTGKTYTLDISTIKGEVTFGFKVYTSADYATYNIEILNIWFE
jgi:hypothetical protein